jgi:2-polyprenyl-6-methoxyphenol hydroxylase-like FAD-dependent oxidoreductase
MDTPRRALIIGAGPGGLSSAIALRRVGIEAAVFERSPTTGLAGGGIGIQSNAHRALQRLGVGDAIERAGTVVRVQEIYDNHGRLLTTLPHGEAADAFGTPSISILRSKLQLALIDMLPDDVLHLGCECTSIEQDAEGVTAHFADGRAERGLILIGADGGRSVARKHIFGEADQLPHYVGVTVWRAVVRMERVLAQDTIWEFSGVGKEFLAFPVGDWGIMWGISALEPANGRDPSEGLHQFLRGHLSDGGFPSLLHDIVTATPEADITRTDLYDRDPDPTWIKGRVVLLGDAAHLTTPFIGQGAGISMEDSVVLAKELALTGGLRDQSMLPVALKAYERVRKPRCETIVLTSRRQGAVVMTGSPALAAARNQVLRRVPRRARRLLVQKSIDYPV